MQMRQMVRLCGVMCVGAVMVTLPVHGQQRCDGAAIATGPFQYAVVSGLGTSFTFLNTSVPVSTAFTVTAPGGGTVFPAESPNGTCSNEAQAEIRVFGIERLAADGSKVDIPLSSALGQQIGGAFALSPSAEAFAIGATRMIAVKISNPSVDGGGYGSYLVTIKAQAIGSGVGVGSGVQVALTLQAPAVCVDNVPPVISVVKPTATEKKLGIIVVKVEAFDPTLPVGCPSGLVSLTAAVSSQGNTVKDWDIPLTLSSSLPAAAGKIVTGDGVFTPTGGAGTSGVTLGTAFLSSSRSGIGSYTITITARDGAGNVSQANVSVGVNYILVFAQAQVPNGCNITNLKPCKAQYKFTVIRAPSAATDPDNYSDGAFIYDETVETDLTKDGSIIESHPYGTGTINSFVQIVSPPEYQTDFDHPAGTPYTQYVLKIYFRDVDGQLRLQGTSAPLSF